MLDFFCSEANLAIELDGQGHGRSGQLVEDAKRDEQLTKMGIEVLRFWNSRLWKEPEVVKRTIWLALERRTLQA